MNFNIESVPMPVKSALDISSLQPDDYFFIRGSRYTFVRQGPQGIVGKDRKGGYWTFHNLFSIERIQAKAEYKPRKRSRYPLNMKDPFAGHARAIAERNDCTVRALAIAAEIPYEDAHQLMAVQCGRKNSKGSNFSTLLQGFGTMADKQAIVGKYKIKWHNVERDYSGLRTKGTTVLQLMKSGKLSNRAVIAIKRHVFAIVDGVAYDTFHAGARSVVNGWYSFEPIWSSKLS